MIDSLDRIVSDLGTLVWGWPLVIFVSGAAIYMTLAFRAVQFRYFFKAWKYVLFPEKSEHQGEDYITPLQAFVNTLSASIGNGSAAGMATAMYSGGPGAAFWIFVLGFFNMAIRFAEVCASTSITNESAMGALRGGPMVYLSLVRGGSFLPTLYAFFALGLAFITGNAMQCNSMRLGIERMTGVEAPYIALLLFSFMLYVMLGGANRIIRVSDKIVPVKVGLFFIATLCVLGYHWQSIIPALAIILKSAFTLKALGGGVAGHTMQEAIRFGMSRSLNATESGLGTAGILFGATGSKHPVRSGIMSMVSTFISNHLVCFMLMLVYVASGVWDSGLTSTPLTIAAYKTVFGDLGGWIVTFLSVTFGMGVLVAYAYIGRECWMYLTRGRYEWLYTIIYCFMALFGALSQVSLIWNMTDLINAGLVTINLYGLLAVLPRLTRALHDYDVQQG